MEGAAPTVPHAKANASVVASTATTNITLDPKVERELSRLDPSIPFNPRARYLHHTWAQTFFCRPELFFQPSSVPELQKIVTLARRCRKRICVTGFGHSPSDLTCTSAWLVNLDNICDILEFDVAEKPGLVRFQAGITLHNLNLALAKKGLTLPNLGSIDVQSVAGVISTGTHGSSLQHGLLSQSITSLTVLLSNGQLVTCSASKNEPLFRAALLSLGSLGIIVEITFQTVPDFNVAWTQSLQPLSSIYSTWSSTLWTTEEFTRVWWLPYLSRAVVWRGSRTDVPARRPETTFYGGKFGYYLYHNLLYLSNSFPRILPWVEWFVFGMQYGFKPGSVTTRGVQPARDALLLDCLYSQFVNEWALPLEKGPEAIRRLSAWVNHDDAAANIPVSSKGVWVHCPVEVRVTNSSDSANPSRVRPFLDPSVGDGPTLYLNATLYRAYHRDPPCHKKYYEAFEYLMRELGGRPHWAKNFEFTTPAQIDQMYGGDMREFMQVRDESDPDGMFLGAWHQRTLPLTVKSGKGFGIMESEVRRERKGLGWGYGDGVLWEGSGGSVEAEEEEDDGDLTPSPPMTSTSEESFDYMAKGEASLHAGSGGQESWKI